MPLLSVDNLTLHYGTRLGDVRAVDGVSFYVDRGVSLGLVGESGCGKSSIALALLRLLPDNLKRLDGGIFLDDVDLLSLSEEEMRAVRWSRISLVFQAAMNSLDPVYRVGDQIVEPMEFHLDLSPVQARERAVELFDLVGLDAGLLDRYPHEYSGGMKQRAIIAMALSCEPDLVIADEPTTALDVLTQDRILRRMRDIQHRTGVGMIYISHDMAVLAEVTDYLGVMYAGKLVEMGETAEVFGAPAHPYTAALMSAVPTLTGEKIELPMIEGEPPDLINPPKGCRFSPRCPLATEVCVEEEPPKGVGDGGRWVACWNPLVETEVVKDDARTRRTAQ